VEKHPYHAAIFIELLLYGAEDMLPLLFIGGVHIEENRAAAKRRYLFLNPLRIWQCSAPVEMNAEYVETRPRQLD
jgi:hypothetical protein